MAQKDDRFLAETCANYSYCSAGENETRAPGGQPDDDLPRQARDKRKELFRELFSTMGGVSQASGTSVSRTPETLSLARRRDTRKCSAFSTIPQR